ncbi:glycosyltransferase family 2 protein [Pleurocapsales cyanobacterium LEGE 06147]|nr:glycosyltransferase family 2 protein [Pleurocapsales cyanobacterium LEGE 06147]
MNIINGVSIIICCHNSANRLPQTLAHLATQKVSVGLPWEVIVIDNASTDRTSQVALSHWSEEAKAPLRVVYEPQLGLSQARERGFLEAQYSFVSFVDDDNWVCPQWIQLVFELMMQHPNIGACGGAIEAICEIEPPWWFERYKGAYAVGLQDMKEGDVTDTRGKLWGAGLTVRRSAWQQLKDQSFCSLLEDRTGTKLSSGGDTELCYALRLAGWRLWYSPKLHLKHFMTAQRLQWSYLRRLSRSFGAASISLEPYHFALDPNRNTFKGKLCQRWEWRFLGDLKNLLLRWYILLISFFTDLEGNTEVLAIEGLLGRFIEILQQRKTYNTRFQKIKQIARKYS